MTEQDKLEKIYEIKNIGIQTKSDTLRKEAVDLHIQTEYGKLETEEIEKRLIKLKDKFEKE